MLASILSLAVALSSSPIAKPEDFENDIATARTRAIDFLKKQQEKDGTWDMQSANIAGMDGGYTALAALALLEAGVKTDDPVIASATAYLAKLEPKKTYVVSLQTQVLVRVDKKKYAKVIQTNADWLIEKAINWAGKLEGWSYPANTVADGSNTHFAVVALREAALAGAKVPEKTWDQIREMYVASRGNGGWRYTPRAGQQATRTMTTAALAGLVIAAEFDKTGKGTDAAFDKGMAALLKGQANQGTSEAYVWFVTAELGRALATREFKAGDIVKAWYREGALNLVKTQQKNGSWEGKTGIDKSPIYATGCALYFLGPPEGKK